MTTIDRVGIAILTVSDSRDETSDTSGAYLAQAVERDGHRLAGRAIVRDDIGQIRETVRRWAEDEAIDVVISTGGTGLTGRDVTPEALLPLFDKIIDGFAPVWHRVSYDVIGLSTMQSRACAGIIGETLVFCLPGSRGAVRDGWTKVIGPQLDRSTKPCNFVEIMPRLSER
jgi:molybdopterin adenylyltransferase